MNFNCKESVKKGFSKISSALRATISFTIKHNRPILAITLSFITVMTLSYFSLSVRKFNFFDGTTSKTVSLIGGNVEKALVRLNVSDDYEIVSAKKSGNTTDVVIQYTFPVTVVAGNDSFVVETTSATVKNILAQVGIKPDKNDIVEPSLETIISKKSTIKYDEVEYVKGSYIETIPYDTKVVYSASLEKGKNTVTKGKNGKQKVYYTQKRINGEVVATYVKNKEIITTAVSGQKTVGTAVVEQPAVTSNQPKQSAVVTSDAVKTISTLTPAAPIALDANGVPVNYKSVKTVQATAYTYTGHRCSTGVSPQPGYIAVNPRIIPYGTKMYIRSSDGSFIYGYAVAADTGGFINSRPTNVDLFFSTSSACRAFGRRNVEIYILE